MPAKNSTPPKSAAKSAPKKRSGKKASTVVQEAAPAPEPVPEPPAPVSTEASTVSAETTTVSTLSTLEQIEQDFQSLQTRLAEFKTLYSTITGDLRTLQKNMQRHIKESSRRGKRTRTSDPNKKPRAPSGFAKPAVISSELCTFLGVPSGTEMARTEVTKHLTQYIKENNLQDQENKRKILPDTKLSSLLNVGTDEDVTYFNLQKYMKVHFPKSAAALAASTSA
jgi:chromatin remodeling complex protein RSC6